MALHHLGWVAPPRRRKRVAPFPEVRRVAPPPPADQKNPMKPKQAALLQREMRLVPQERKQRDLSQIQLHNQDRNEALRQDLKRLKLAMMSSVTC